MTFRLSVGVFSSGLTLVKFLLWKWSDGADFGWLDRRCDIQRVAANYRPCFKRDENSRDQCMERGL